MKVKLLGTLVILFLSQSAQAHGTTRPQKCPEVKTIQSVGMTTIMQQSTGWFGSVESAFGTEYQWTFIMGPVDAQSEVQARDKLSATLGSLSLLGGPIPYSHVSICQYDTEHGVKAAAINPPMPS
jgi:hypothetical protein